MLTSPADCHPLLHRRLRLHWVFLRDSSLAGHRRVRVAATGHRKVVHSIVRRSSKSEAHITPLTLSTESYRLKVMWTSSRTLEVEDTFICLFAPASRSCAKNICGRHTIPVDIILRKVRKREAHIIPSGEAQLLPSQHDGTKTVLCEERFNADFGRLSVLESKHFKSWIHGLGCHLLWVRVQQSWIHGLGCHLLWARDTTWIKRRAKLAQADEVLP